ncbi:B-cell linker protein [Stigmatopora argus]
MEIISKITASATAKIRQLQKITQDIQKNDSSYLIKLKRLKTKPVPDVPMRDYKEQVWGAEPEYDNDVYENPMQGNDVNYEPPPSHSVMTRISSSSFPIEAYVDSCNNWPNKGYRKAVKRCKEPQRFPQQPSHMDNTDEDYINPDDSNEDDNYIEPAENPPSGKMYFKLTRKRERLVIERSYEFIFVVLSHGTDPPESSLFYPPKPIPRSLPKPPLRQVQVAKQRDFECRTLPIIQKDCRPHSPKFTTLDMQHPMIPPPSLSFLKQTESHSGENGTINQSKDADIYKESWFSGECDRNTAYQLLFHAKEDGAFMVRKSSGQDTNHPYTLVVYYKDKVYNIPIRFIHTRQQFALGSEKKTEVYFHSISQIIEKHQKKPLVLIDSKSNSKDAVMLRPLKETTTSGHHHTPDAFLPSL